LEGIHLVPLLPDRDLSLARLADSLRASFRLPVSVDQLPVPVEEAYDASRRQYHSGHLLMLILRHAPAGNGKILGVTSRDLFIPVLTHVFGQAQLNNRAAVFSSFRLRNDLYGLRHSHALLRERSLKEAMHELGHTFGLRHCSGGPCVMNPSTYVEDIDLKPAEFCLTCHTTVFPSQTSIQTGP